MTVEGLDRTGDLNGICCIYIYIYIANTANEGH